MTATRHNGELYSSETDPRPICFLCNDLLNVIRKVSFVAVAPVSSSRHPEGWGRPAPENRDRPIGTTTDNREKAKAIINLESTNL